MAIVTRQVVELICDSCDAGIRLTPAWPDTEDGLKRACDVVLWKTMRNTAGKLLSLCCDDCVKAYMEDYPDQVEINDQTGNPI